MKHVTEDRGPDCDVSRRHSLLFLKCLSFFPSQTFIDVYLVLGPCTFSFTASAARLVSALCSRFETFTAETSLPHAAALTIQGILDLALTTPKAGFTQKVFKNRFEKKYLSIVQSLVTAFLLCSFKYNFLEIKIKISMSY